MLDKIVILRLCTQTTLAASSLTRIGRDGRAFYVPGICDSDRHLLVGDQVFDIELDARVNDHRSAAVTKLPSDLGQFVCDYLAQNAFVLKNILELCDVLNYRLVFVEYLLAFESRQPTQLQIEYCLSLNVGKIEAGYDLVEFF